MLKIILLDFALPDDATLVDEVDGDLVEEGNAGIFHRKTFIFFGFEEGETTELGEYIVERGGKWSQ